MVKVLRRMGRGRRRGRESNLVALGVFIIISLSIIER
jgi:hypothetical protein